MRPQDDPAYVVQLRLREENPNQLYLAFYEPSPGQLPDHVHNRVARVAVDELRRKGFLPPDKPSLIGRDRVLVERLAKSLLNGIKKQHNYTELRETPRGNTFEVEILGSDDHQPTGHVARVTIELDRVEQAK